MFLFRALADPVVICLVGMAVGGGLWRLGIRRLGVAIAISAAALLYLLSTPLVGARLLASLERGFSPVAGIAVEEAEAIVVLSADLRREAKEFGGDTVGDLTLERMRYGAVLQRQTGLPVLVTGGTIGRSRERIARLMAKIYKAEFGLKVRWVEDRARNTFENALLSRKFLERDKIKKVYLVTHAWHMRRAVAAFEQSGLSVVPAATGFTFVGPRPSLVDLVPRSAALTTSAYALHEWIGLLWYEVAYFE